MTTMSDAMRGYLLDPLDGNEIRRKAEADAALEKAVGRLRSGLSELPEILAMVERIAHFEVETLNSLKDQMMPMIALDREQAVTSYLPARMQEMGNG